MEYGIEPMKRETETKRTRTRVCVLVYKKEKVLKWFGAMRPTDLDSF